jgi:hypothetical protein
MLDLPFSIDTELAVVAISPTNDPYSLHLLFGKRLNAPCTEEPVRTAAMQKNGGSARITFIP